jgi:hypothetical protein
MSLISRSVNSIGSGSELPKSFNHSTGGTQSGIDGLSPLKGRGVNGGGFSVGNFIVAPAR